MEKKINTLKHLVLKESNMGDFLVNFNYLEQLFFGILFGILANSANCFFGEKFFFWIKDTTTGI